ncbi:BrnT family toxin [Microgenomates group bacterium]|nr:BrnT family toxin [Microgenomates group bacterium]
MDFEFDNKKSKANLVKHEIDFVDGQRLWENETIEVLSAEKPEIRYLHVGKIDGKFWTAVITYREQNIRIISIRRARKEERKVYEKNVK